jgi:hypothetical protein
VCIIGNHIRTARITRTLRLLSEEQKQKTKLDVVVNKGTGHEGRPGATVRLDVGPPSAFENSKMGYIRGDSSRLSVHTYGPPLERRGTTGNSKLIEGGEGGI